MTDSAGCIGATQLHSRLSILERGGSFHGCKFLLLFCFFFFCPSFFFQGFLQSLLFVGVQVSYNPGLATNKICFRTFRFHVNFYLLIDIVRHSIAVLDGHIIVLRALHGKVEVSPGLELKCCFLIWGELFSRFNLGESSKILERLNFNCIISIIPTSKVQRSS